MSMLYNTNINYATVSDTNGDIRKVDHGDIQEQDQGGAGLYHHLRHLL